MNQMRELHEIAAEAGMNFMSKSMMQQLMEGAIAAAVASGVLVHPPTHTCRGNAKHLRRRRRKGDDDEEEDAEDEDPKAGSEENSLNSLAAEMTEEKRLS